MTPVHSIQLVSGVPCVRFARAPNFEECKATVDDLANNYPYERRLYDFTGSGLHLTKEEILAIAAYGKTAFVRPNKAALVAPDDLSYGVVRVFEVYREQQGHSTARVFKTREGALAWLLTEPEAAR